MLWRRHLPNDTTGKSDLYLKGDTVFILNKGFGYCTGYKEIGAKYVKAAPPYLAAYDKHKGTLLYHKALKEEQAMCVSSTEQNGILYVLLMDTLISVQLSTGEVINTMILEDDLSDVWYFARDSIMYQDNEDGTYTCISDKYPGCAVMLDKASNVHVINKELEIVDFAKGSKYYFKKDLSPYYCLQSTTKTIIYHGDKMLAVLADEYTPDILDVDKAILLTRRSITILDLHKLR